MASKVKLDNATEKLYSENEAIIEMAKSDGWKLLRKEIMNSIVDMQSVNNVEGKTDSEIALNVQVRKEVVVYLWEFFKGVDGTINQHNAFKESLEVDPEVDYIEQAK